MPLQAPASTMAPIDVRRDVAADRVAERLAAMRVAVEVDGVPVGRAEDRRAERTVQRRVGVLDEKPHRRRIDGEGRVDADAAEVVARHAAGFVFADRLAVDRQRAPLAERQV